MIRVLTEHPVAVDSLDHKVPGGTMMDDSRNHKFNEILYGLRAGPLKIMDLGCAGGGFVKDCLGDGHFAVGLEGSDYSLLRKRAQWATIPDNLFTTDITKPFTVLVDGEPCRFDIVTMWEVAEHIEQGDLPALCLNVRNHLAPAGWWIMSVSRQPGGHHVCVKQRQWWEGFFEREGFRNRPDVVAKFGKEFVRGEAYGAPDSFHLILEEAL